MSKHTPGPWSNNKWNSEEHQIAANGGTIALVSHSHSLVSEEQADANGMLIAAAPETLAALEDVGRALAAFRDRQHYSHPEFGALTLEEVLYCVVEPAIAQARGEAVTQ